MPRRPHRNEYTGEHDNFLVKYLAKYCPTKEGRSGNRIFKELEANKNNKWPWSVHHSWQSWRERYVKNSDVFDARIRNYQRKHDVQSTDKRKRAADPMPKDTLEPSAKRIKLQKEEEEESSSSESHAANANAGPSRPKPKSTVKSPPKRASDPPRTLPQAPNPTQPTETRRTAPASPSRVNAHAGTSPIKEPADLQTRDDTPEISSTSPDRQMLFRAETSSPPRHVKRIKVRRGTPSDIFASEPPSPTMDAAAPPSVEASSSKARPPPVSASPRAPPRVVDSLRGKVLVDREGHMPRMFPLEEERADEEEEDKSQWPPVRGKAAKQMRASRPDAEADVHHAFSQPQPRPQPEALPEGVETGKREQAKPALDRRTVADLFLGRIPQAEGGQREDVVRNGTSPVKRVVAAAAPSDSSSGHIPKPPPKSFKFPVPRASTQSPFRPERPAEEIRRPPAPPEPQRRPPSRKAARRAEPTRIRRQSIGKRNVHQREVPSVDLVAQSRTSTSVRSHSNSSASTSALARPHRWSLPAFAHATPWVFDEAPSMFGDLLFGRTRTTSLETSTPRFTSTSSPALSVTGVTAATSAATLPLSHANKIPAPVSPSVSLSLVPHPSDAQLTASHGLAMILAHMSANHGLALGVVEAVYKQVRSLREADEVLKGMREAAEGFGEREIKKRMREQRVGMNGRGRREGDRGGVGANGKGKGKMALRYVIASEEGETSEYSPPETSRAAMWKRQSESSCVEEEGCVEEDGDDEEAKEGREVEEELWDVDEDEDNREDVPHHDFSRHVAQERENNEDEGDHAQRREDTSGEQRVMEALLEDTKLAQELEKKVGKGRYRQDVTRLFV